MKKIKVTLVISVFVLFAFLNLNTVQNSNDYNDKTVTMTSAYAGDLYQNYELKTINSKCKKCVPMVNISCDVSEQCCLSSGIPCEEPE